MNGLKILKWVCVGVTAVVSIVSSVVNDKQQSRDIDDAVKKYLNK